jgi:hypothetical protein
MRTRPVLAVLPIALLVVTVASAAAAPKETKGEFTAAATPDPGTVAACEGVTPTSRHTVPFSVPAAGKMVVEISGFQGDWDLQLRGQDGSVLGESAGFLEEKEIVTVKFKKAQDVVIVACNYAGGPSAAGTFVYTPSK